MRNVIQIILLVVLATIALAEWPDAGGVPVCTATGDQTMPKIVSDGHGGAYIVWSDSRGDDEDIYAQYVDAYGNILWETNGAVVCTSEGRQYDYDMINNTYGGPVIVWASGIGNQIRGQFISPTGLYNWDPDGYLIAAHSRTVLEPIIKDTDIINDIVVTFKFSGWSHDDPYTKKINIHGYYEWLIENDDLSNRTSKMSSTSLEGHNTLIVGDWNNNIKALKKINEDGIYLWTSDINVADPSVNRNPKIINNGLSSVLITWEDNRRGNFDIYANTIDNLGTLGIPNGWPICVAADSQLTPLIVSDGSGGAIIAWNDRRSGSSMNFEIYEERMDYWGNRLWNTTDTTGIPIINTTGNQKLYDMIPTDDGGAILVWISNELLAYHVFAQRIDGDGNALWDASGVQVTTGTFEELPVICSPIVLTV